MQRQEIKSSTIKSAGWEKDTETLQIEFCSGGVYDYSGVPEKTWDAFLKAESKGSFFMSCIRGQFPYICLNPKPPKEKKHGQSEEKDSKTTAKGKTAKKAKA